MPDTPSPRERIVAQLHAAGLPATEAEIDGFVAGHETWAAGIESLYAIPECRYESPALTFTATPAFADWDRAG
jgi:hypothetical protein